MSGDQGLLELERMAATSAGVTALLSTATEMLETRLREVESGPVDDIGAAVAWLASNIRMVEATKGIKRPLSEASIAALHVINARLQNGEITADQAAALIWKERRRRPSSRLRLVT